MSGSGTAVDEEHIRENFESSKKEKKHKHKKDKKHKRHKERQRSAPSEEVCCLHDSPVNSCSTN